MINQVAETILTQMGGVKRLHAMIGAHSFVGSETDVSFQFKAQAKNGIKSCTITLDPSDTYTVRFYAGRDPKTFELRLVETHGDIYCDMLVEVFERATGLYLHL